MCGEKKSQLTQHLKLVHKVEEELPEHIDLVHIEINETDEKPLWSEMTARAIELLEGLATYQDISIMILKIFPILQRRNVPLAKVCTNVNNVLSHYKFFKCIKVCESWYVLKKEWLDYSKNGKKKRRKITFNFKNLED